MKLVHVMPGAIIALSLCAAIVYAWHGDWRRAIYWAAAVALNLSVTV